MARRNTATTCQILILQASYACHRCYAATAIILTAPETCPPAWLTYRTARYATWTAARHAIVHPAAEDVVRTVLEYLQAVHYLEYY